MFLGLAATEDVHDPDAPSEERVRKERPMALPRQCLGAHDGGPGIRGAEDEVVQRRDEFRGGHVIRVSPERIVPPTSVAIVRSRAAIAAKSF